MLQETPRRLLEILTWAEEMGVYCSLGVYWNLLSSEKKKEQKIKTNWKELKKTTNILKDIDETENTPLSFYSREGP